jgi:leucyl aminopeptidase (aminopeptidase T)
MTLDDASPAALARSMVSGALRVRRGENLVVETWNHCLPYATACVAEARRIGAHPMLLLEDEATYWTSVENPPGSLRWSHPGAHEWAALARANAYVFFPGPADRPRYRALPADVRNELVGYNAEWYRRARAAHVRGVRSILGYASDAQAARWGVPGAEWRRSLILGAVNVDLPALSKSGKAIASRLQKGTTLRVQAPNGTDVRLTLRHRKAIVDDGVVTPDDIAVGRNMTVSPPGAVGAAVDERTAEGVAIANRASYLPIGKVDGGEWEIAHGRLTQSRATDGQHEFDAAYAAAPKGRDVVSIFSIGLNPHLGPAIPQVEDQEAGAVTLGIGGNVEYGGTNRCPFVAWIVIGEATVAIDGKPVCDRGQLL